jgi:hypothetical protein
MASFSAARECLVGRRGWEDLASSRARNRESARAQRAGRNDRTDRTWSWLHSDGAEAYAVTHRCALPFRRVRYYAPFAAQALQSRINLKIDRLASSLVSFQKPQKEQSKSDPPMKKWKN